MDIVVLDPLTILGGQLPTAVVTVVVHDVFHSHIKV